MALTNSAGATLQVHAYDPYGVTGANNTGRFQYTGQAAIPEVGLYYYKARFYHPQLGRFLQTDPIGYEDDNNLYAYVGNDPLNKTDPSGEDCVDPSTGPCEEVVVTATKPLPPTTAGISIPADRPIPPIALPRPVTIGGGVIALWFANALFRESCGDSGTIGPCAKNKDNAVLAEQKPPDKSRRSKPTNAPPGTKPIDQSGKSSGWIHGTKEDVGAGPADWVGVAPNGDIITTGSDGAAVNHGPSTQENK